MLTIVTDAPAPSEVVRWKGVLRDVVVAASGMAVALTGLTTEGVNLVSWAERLVIVQRQAAIALGPESHIEQ